MQKARRSSIQSTKTYKAFQAFQPQDLPQAFQFYKDIPVIPDIPVIHDIPAFQALLHVPAFLQSECKILHTDWFPLETPLSTSRRQYTTNFHSSKKGRCYDMGQNDTIGKIELIPSSVLSEDNTNCCNDIHKFLQQFE